MSLTFKKSIVEIFTAIITGLIFWIFYCQLQPYFLKISNLFFSNLPIQESFNNRSILTCIIFSLAGYHAINQIYKTKFPSLKSIVLCSIVGLLYFRLFRQDSEIYFFLLTNNSDIYLCDIILFSSFLALSNYSHFQIIIRQHKKGIIQEVTELDEQEDKLHRYKQANELIRLIERTNPKISVSISITAEWGNGKSVFLNFLEKKLEKTSLIVRFNPWIARQNQTTIGIFFDLLKEKLFKYDSKTAETIHKYSNNVLLVESEDSFFLKIFKLFLGFLIPKPSTLSDQKAEINASINLIGKKIIVFIDDLDRVSPEEILEVMNLIRNTADFNNTIFIVAMDLGYIKTALTSSNPLLDVDRYLEKIFQLQFVLPPIMFDSIKELLEFEFDNFLENNSDLIYPDNFSLNFKSALTNISAKLDFQNGYPNFTSFNKPGILEETLNNIRDIKRFLNSFLLSYKLLGGELDMNDLILLEFLKLKFTSFYIRLSKRDFILFDDDRPGRWRIDTNSFNTYLETNESSLLQKIFGELYINPGSDSIPRPNSITYIQNHNKYFNHDLFGDISLVEIFKAKSNGIGHLEKYFKQIVFEASEKEDDKEKSDMILQLRTSKFFQFLIKSSNSEKDDLVIFESILFLRHLNLSNFYLTETLRTKLLVQLNTPDYKKSFASPIQGLFKKDHIELSFKLDLFIELKKRFIQDLDDSIWHKCLQNCTESLFFESNQFCVIDLKLQEDIMYLFTSWLKIPEEDQSLLGDFHKSLDNFKSYFTINPQLLLTRIFIVYKTAVKADIDTHLFEFFYLLNQKIPAKENCIGPTNPYCVVWLFDRWLMVLIPELDPVIWKKLIKIFVFV